MVFWRKFNIFLQFMQGEEIKELKIMKRGNESEKKRLPKWEPPQN